MVEQIPLLKMDLMLALRANNRHSCWGKAWMKVCAQMSRLSHNVSTKVAPKGVDGRRWLLKRGWHAEIRMFRICQRGATWLAAAALASSPSFAGGIYVSKGDLYWSGQKTCVEWSYTGGSGVHRCSATESGKSYPCRGVFNQGEKMDIERNIPRGATVNVRRCI